MSELVIAEDQRTWTDAQKAALVQMGLGDAPRGDIEVFFHQAQRAGLDPFAKQIYLIGRNSKQGNQWVKKYTIQTSIEGFRIIRDRQKTRPYRGHTEQWCGEDGVWKDAWLSKEPPAAARVLLSIEGFTQPVPGVALWSEYAPMKDGKPTGLWATKPSIMLAKCAEALALRKAYPHDLSGLYEDSEMDQASAPAVTAAEPQGGAQSPAPEVREPSRDWLADANAATSYDELKVVFEGAAAAGDLAVQIADGRTLRDYLFELREKLAAAPKEDVVDAEVVEEPAEQTPMGWPVAEIPKDGES